MDIKEFIETCLDEIAAIALVFSGIAYLFWTKEVERSLSIIGVGAMYLFGKKKGEVNT